MPATSFRCPDGAVVPIQSCLEHCPNGCRCMFLPTLRVIGETANRNIWEPTVTELIGGVRETYLKRTKGYTIDPKDRVFAVYGTSVHTTHSLFSEDFATEVRLNDGIMSGQFDVYGNLLDEESKILGDYKVVSSYKLMEALGYYKVDVPTGEVYKTGIHKGEPKTRKEWRTDGVRDVLEWAIQLNYYRIMLEKRGFEVKGMMVQAMVRDYSTKTCRERNIDKPVYVIPIHKISDHWILLYLREKARRLKKSMASGSLPAPCSARETWNGKKCLDYCPVAEFCDHAIALKAKVAEEPLQKAS